MKRIISILIIVMILISLQAITFASNTNENTSGIKDVVVEQYNGAPAVMITYNDGEKKPFSKFPYSQLGVDDRTIGDMVEDGFSVAVTITLGQTDYDHYGMWKGVDENGNNIMDYTKFDETINKMLKRNPNLQFYLRMENTSYPIWWLKKNEGERNVIADEKGELHKVSHSYDFIYGAISENERENYIELKGSSDYNARVSPFSRKWIDDSSKAWKDVIKHVMERYSDNLLGFSVQGFGTSEMYYSTWPIKGQILQGYGEQAETEFRKWLKEKYVTNKKLQESWAKDGTFTFDDIKIPSPKRRRASAMYDQWFRNVKEDKDLMDFYRFYNEWMAIFSECFGKVVKETAGNRLVGVQYGYMYEFHGFPETGHLGLERLNSSPYIDFIQVCASYTNRQYGSGSEMVRGPVQSLNLNNKIWWQDNDAASYLLKKMADEETKKLEEALGPNWMNDERRFEISDFWILTAGYYEEYYRILAGTATLEETINFQKRVMGFTLANGMYYDLLDLHKMYYDDPDMRKAMLDLEKVFVKSLSYDRSSAAQILFVVDEKSCDSVIGRGVLQNDYHLYNNFKELSKLNAPYDSILISDLDKVNIDQYKLVVFLNTFNMNKEDRVKVERVKGGNRVVMWSWASGYMSDNNISTQNMYSLTGFEFEIKDEFLKYSLINSQNKTAVENYEKFNINDNLLKKLKKSGYIEGIGTFYPTNKDITPLFIYNYPIDLVAGGYLNMRSEQGRWTSLYMPNGVMNVSQWKALAEFSGVHIYNHQKKEKDSNLQSNLTDNDTFYANSSYITLHANGDGKRTINMPVRADIYDAQTDELLYKNVTKFEIDMKNGETLLARVNYKETPPWKLSPSKDEEKNTDTGNNINNVLLIALIGFAIVIIVANYKKVRSGIL